MLVTAGEGVGKSVLLRQIGVQAAAGIHPWTGANIEPRNVLIVDLENSDRQVSRALKHLVVQAGTSLDPSRLRVCSRADGIDLTTRTDRRWLLERCIANRAELLVIGPLYRMESGVASRGDTGGQDKARQVTAALDDIRMRTGVALLMETHAPHGDGLMRDLRPFGSSVWLRWPEFGIGLRLDPDREDPNCYVLKHWRGPRDVRIWPKRLLKGRGRWMWTPDGLPDGTFTSVA
jgi:RecA-family ATPase